MNLDDALAEIDEEYGLSGSEHAREMAEKYWNLRD